MKYVVKSPVKHGGVVHEPGSKLDLADAIAAPLVAVGAIGPIVKAVESTEPTDKKGKKE